MTSRSRGWYWQQHTDEYDRWAVGDLPEFSGWQTLIDLILECENTRYYEKSSLFTRDQNPDLTVRELRSTLVRRDKGLISTAFSTGGRISEVLMLKRKNFLIFDKYVAVLNMPVIKRWRKIDEIAEVRDLYDKPMGSDKRKWHLVPEKGIWVKRKFVTEPVMDRRNRLHLPLHEPLSRLMADYVQQFNDGENCLFPRYCKAGNPPISSSRAYQIFRDLGERLGLMKRDEQGRTVNEHVCNHWFRSERASQLSQEYGFREFELKRFFSWTSDQMASRYAKLSPDKLYDMMKPEYVELPSDFERNGLQIEL